MGNKSSSKEPETKIKINSSKKEPEINTRIQVNKINMPKVKVLSKVNPFRKLKHNVLNYLFDFIEIVERSKQHKYVNKQFRKAIPTKVKKEKYYVENKVMFEGKENMTDVYLTAQIPENIFRPLKLNIMIETKDQGWATHTSSSWVDLLFYKDKDAKVDEATHLINLTNNQAEKEFKIVEKKFDLEKLNDEYIKEITSNIFPNGKMNIFSNSRYFGWVCHMKQASIEFIYLSVTNEY